MRLVGCTIRIYYDARTYERQIGYACLFIHCCKLAMPLFFGCDKNICVIEINYLYDKEFKIPFSKVLCSYMVAVTWTGLEKIFETTSKPKPNEV